MYNFCPKCGTKKRTETAKFCRKCGFDFYQRKLPMRSDQAQLSSFDPLRKLSGLIEEQEGWLRQNTLLEPLQKIIDNISLRTGMEQATDQQKEQILAGYQEYTRERVEQAIDPVRQARRLADADVSLEIKQRDLEIEDTIAKKEHERRMERLAEVHKHEKEVLELRAQLELVNAVIQSFNQLRMIQLEAQAEGLADIQQIEKLGKIIKLSTMALAEIDASQIEYTQRLEELGFENLEDARSYQLMEELIEAITDRVTKGVVEFGEQRRDNQKVGRGT